MQEVKQMLRVVNNALLFYLIIYLFAPLSISNEVLKPYKNAALDIIKQHCIKGQYFDPPKQFLYFTNLPDNEIGECDIPRSYAYYIIKIDSSYWNRATEEQRYEVMVHEMTHCTLFLQHSDDKNNYMYYSIVGLTTLEVNKQFIDNLRSHCGN
jgi:hypothetical protein